MRGTGPGWLSILSSITLKEVRRHISCAFLGFFLANFGTTLWLTNLYIATKQIHPDIVAGLVHRFNDHGTYYYVSATESAAVILTFWCGWCALLIVLVVVPKEFTLPPPQAPRWVNRVSVRFKTGLENFRLSYFVTTVLALVVSIALIVFAGARIALFAASHGIVAG